jgi:hypothetical protein
MELLQKLLKLAVWVDPKIGALEARKAKKGASVPEDSIYRLSSLQAMSL